MLHQEVALINKADSFFLCVAITLPHVAGSWWVQWDSNMLLSPSAPCEERKLFPHFLFFSLFCTFLCLYLPHIFKLCLEVSTAKNARLVIPVLGWLTISFWGCFEMNVLRYILPQHFLACCFFFFVKTCYEVSVISLGKWCPKMHWLHGKYDVLAFSVMFYYTTVCIELF